MVFTCIDKTNGAGRRWQGNITNLINHEICYEMMITSRSSIMVLFGKTSRGGFACIPDFGVGCHLVNLKDRFWNKQKLTESLGRVDGITVESALYSLSDNINF